MQFYVYISVYRIFMLMIYFDRFYNIFSCVNKLLYVKVFFLRRTQIYECPPSDKEDRKKACVIKEELAHHSLYVR
jgi:hypothetical protein